jgi:hypothetical protein
MSVDPSDPDTFETEPDPVHVDLEAPEADAAEQRFEMEEHREAPPRSDVEANPADAAEQARVVESNEDDYR